MGKKYIIELPEKYILEGDNGSKYLQIPVADSDRELIIRSTMPLTPYTEPDTEAIEKEAYQRGLNDAWEAAKKIVSIPTAELHTMLDKAVYYDTVFRDCTASECIEKIRAYEEKKKAEQEIKVGDEVYFCDKQNLRVVTAICENTAVQFTSCGKWCVNDISELHKTGRHFPEIAEIMKKMKGAE